MDDIYKNLRQRIQIIISTNQYKHPHLNDLNLIMEYLANEKSINTLLVESGSEIYDALLANKLIDEFILYQAPKLLGKGRKTFSKFGETNQKLSTIDFEINTITNLGQDKKIIMTPNYK